MSDPTPILEFHAALPDDLLRPVPAKSLLPPWYKHISTLTDDVDFSTVKRCPPFFEALTCGYLILLELDLKIERKPNGQTVIDCAEPILERHPPVQVAGTPMENITVLKLLNRWLVKTPPGYSTLFIHPLNRGPSPLTALAGLVETDTYYREINFPMLCQLAPGESIALPRGSPMVQLIPLLREAWGTAVGTWDFQARLQQEDGFAANNHLYRDHHWTPKKYS